MSLLLFRHPQQDPFPQFESARSFLDAAPPVAKRNTFEKEIKHKYVSVTLTSSSLQTFLQRLVHRFSFAKICLHSVAYNHFIQSLFTELDLPSFAFRVSLQTCFHSSARSTVFCRVLFARHASAHATRTSTVGPLRLYRGAKPNFYGLNQSHCFTAFEFG